MNSNSRDIELEQTIDAYLKGNLSEQEVDELWVKLLQKPQYLTFLETEIDVARFHQAKPQKKFGRGYSYWKWVAAAAAIALLVIAINFFTGRSQKSIQEWAEARITLTENLSSAEVMRSAAVISTSDSLLNVGFKAAIDGNTPNAKAIYQTIITRYDDPEVISKAHLNLGILQYNANEYASSIENFKKAIAISQDNPLLMERSYWYLGNAFIKIEQLEEARTAVRQAYKLGRIYKVDAFKLLKRLDYELGYIDEDTFEQQIDNVE